MESTAHVVADSAFRHPSQRLLDHLTHPVLARVVPAGEQKLHGRRVRELGRRAETAVANVELAGHLARGPLQGRRGDLAELRFVKRLSHVAADRCRALRHLFPLLAIEARHLFEHGEEARPAVVVLLRGEVGAAEENFALGRETRREGPAALTGERLHGALVARIHVGPLVAVHLDAHEVAIEGLGDACVLIRLAVHDVAPVAPHGADVQEDRLILGARPRERRLAPGMPVHRLVGGGFEVGGGFGCEEIRHRAKSTHSRQLLCSRYRTAVLVTSSVPITRLSSSISNVGLWCGEPFLSGGAEPTNAKAPGTFARKYDMSSPPMVRMPLITRSCPTMSWATPFINEVIFSSLTSGFDSRRYRTSASAPNARAMPRAVSSMSCGASSKSFPPKVRTVPRRSARPGMTLKACPACIWVTETTPSSNGLRRRDTMLCSPVTTCAAISTGSIA